jgi:hypothetical protein
MKAVVDIKDSRAAFVMELLDSLPGVKVKAISGEKALLLRELKEAVDAVNLAKQGAPQARPAKALLDEL